MLFQLDDTSKANVEKLLAFARQNKLQLSLVDDNGDNMILPGKPLKPNQLKKMIEEGRKTGIVSLQDAHQIIRKNYNAD